MNLVKLADKDTHFKLDESLTLTELGVKASQLGGNGPNFLSVVGSLQYIDFRMEGKKILRIFYKQNDSGCGGYCERRRIVI